MAVVILAHTLQELCSFPLNFGGGAGVSSIVVMTFASAWAVQLVLLFSGRMPRTGARI